MQGKPNRKRHRVETICERCGETFMGRTDRGGQRYCSRACAPKPPVRSGKANNRYNGGLSTTPDGRGLIVCRDGTLLLYYRGLMAAHIGRLLRRDEIVHHVNGDPSDDRIENLRLTTRSEHIEMHRAELLAGAHAAGFPTGDDWRARRGLA